MSWVILLYSNLLSKKILLQKILKEPSNKVQQAKAIEEAKKPGCKGIHKMDLLLMS
ncbi:MAG: hypothetical protein JJ840_09325 [Prochlorococcus marinus CUG1431]|uniref:Uncharacterized protein n=1 Tax=Prochlorococcus marinus CUG1433 TaxID=2774506 RepID=A0A9D9BX82_PROMR|nr:hypothetical protein [Prochlorococcus marinus CUG1433]MBO6981550.1 hypothetical protein [Prochlorococcus marinus CUG1431]